MPIEGQHAGFKEARETLHDLSKAMQRGVGRRALKQTAEILVQATKDRAPESTDPNNQTPGSLKAAPRVVTAKAGKRAEAAVAVLVEDPAAVRVEFGSVHNRPAEPFFRPAIDASRKEMTDEFGAKLAAEVVAAAERVAKRAAKAGR